MFDVNGMQQAMMLRRRRLSGEIEIQKVKQLKDAPDLYEVQFDHVKVTANYPVVNYGAATELQRHAGSQHTQSVDSCYRKIVKGDYLQKSVKSRTERIKGNVDEALEASGDTVYTSADGVHQHKEHLSDDHICGE